MNKSFCVGDLVLIKYSGKPILPSKISGWRYSDKDLEDDGKFGIILYEKPHVTTAGEFMYLLTARGKYLHHVCYLESVERILDGIKE